MNIKIQIVLSLVTLTSLMATEPQNETDPTLIGSDKNVNISDDNPTMAGDSISANLDKKSYFLGSQTIMDAFKNGKVKGLIRYSAQNRDSNLHVLQDDPGNPPPDQNIKQYSALGGYLGYETAPLYNITIGGTFYTSNPVGNNPNQYSGLGGLGERHNEQVAYSVLGEAYLKYDDSKSRLVIGRQEMPDYRFVSLSNIRMSPLTHEGVTYENRSIENLRINFAYIDKMKERNAVKFIDMIEGSRVSQGKTEGNIDSSNYDADGHYVGKGEAMSMVGAVYTGEGYVLEGWDYYIPNFINTTYAYAQFSTDVLDDITLSFALQGSTQDDVGDAVAGNISSWFWGAKIQAYSEGVTFFTNVNQIAYNENSYDGGTIFVRWGTPQMFNSFQVQDSELAGTKSLGFGLQYDLGYHNLLPHFVARVRYGIYDMPDALEDKYAAQDRTEATFDLRWSLEKTDGFGIFTQMDGLSVQFRIAYDDYKTDYDFAAYQAEHGYSFESVTSDFVDTRLYIDYQF